ncbi:MAG: bacillithiol biosynthesis cysteine-adding enzyme BshC [Lysinibacillus sp.]
MRLESIQVPVKNQVLTDYWSKNTAIHSFFEYEYNHTSFQKRANYLKGNAKDQTVLASVIRQFMKPLGLSDKANEHIQQLQEGAVAVVGGQQAGVLTGPLYAIHKAITVITLAKQQSEKLHMPVVPVFWIAGEDHDLEEINHTFTVNNGEIKKRAYSERSKYKTMASTTVLNKEVMTEFIDKVIMDFGETEHTKEIVMALQGALTQSKTFTDFFARLMNQLFAHEGLLLIDAADDKFRQFESNYFAHIINNSEEIARLVTEQEQELEKAGYGLPIQATNEAANLFYVKDGERYLLERRQGLFVNLSANIKLTKEEIFDIAENHPEQLSNNVVTRPLMQEMTFPVLAFVGGPGELAYWATLKNAFSVLGLQMPIFALRLNITLVTRQVEQLLNEYDLTVQDVWYGKVERLKEQFISDVQDSKAKHQIEQLKQVINESYAELETHLLEQTLHLNKVVGKNKENHTKQLDYLQQKIEQSVLQKHEATIRKFTTLQDELYPNGAYQERTFNPYQYMNDYGLSLIEDLAENSYTISNSHYVVYL